MVGDLRWRAGVLSQGRYNHLADVFSYGVLGWEVFHEAVPFAEMIPIAVMVKMQNNVRPAFNSTCCSPEATALISRCWHADPTRRPTMEEVAVHVWRGAGAHDVASDQCVQE